MLAWRSRYAHGDDDARKSIYANGRDLNARETGDARRPRTSRGREIRPGMGRVGTRKSTGPAIAHVDVGVYDVEAFRDDATDETRLFRREMYRKKRE